jgi:hypothetical protein
MIMSKMSKRTEVTATESPSHESISLACLLIAASKAKIAVSITKAVIHIIKCVVVGDGFVSTIEMRNSEYTKKEPTMKTFN